MPPTQYTLIANSTFLDAFGALAVGTGDELQKLANNTANDEHVAKAALEHLLWQHPTPHEELKADNHAGLALNVGLTLQRAAPDSALQTLLAGDWADRQSYLASQGENIWSTFGADQAQYDATKRAILEALDIRADATETPFTHAAEAGYIASAENRTIWLSLTADQFNTLFHSKLLTNDHRDTLAWAGPLSLPTTVAPAIAGLWVEESVDFQNPNRAAGAPAPIHPTAGPVSLGNSAGDHNASVGATPAAIADYYNFPLANGLSAPAIALVEAGLYQPGLLEALNEYRAALGVPPLSPEQFQRMGAVDIDIGSYLGEVAIDVSVLSGIAGGSALYLYGADYTKGAAPVTYFRSYQNAFFDTGLNPEILSSSYGNHQSMTANSPFQRAWQQLFVDGMLSGVSVHIAVGDQGSSGYFGNGIGNLAAANVPAYALSVGGTSIATPFSAANDATLAGIFQLAMQGDAATIFELVAAGLTVLPSRLSTLDPAALTAGSEHAYAGQLTHLIESVWNTYAFVRDHDRDRLEVYFSHNEAGSGGVDQTQPVPSYQSAFGLTPGATPASPNGSGRGAPDVAALSSGDTYYMLLNADHVTDSRKPLISGTGGTSAAAPLWATLTSQFNVIFKDQGLPSLGFYNDLLYIAAAVAPASFNDIVLGNNDAGYYRTDHHTHYEIPVKHKPGLPIEPTGAGYAAAPGYDLVSGLGTPNGTLLGRALTQIAHEQMYFDSVDAFLAGDGSGGWTAGVAESLLVQASSSSDATVHLSVGSDGTSFFSAASDSFAWTARLAQQSLQADFDPALVLMYDGQSQGALLQTRVAAGASLGVAIDGVHMVTPQGGITTPYGFADFATAPNAQGFSPDVRLALPVAIAETAGGLSDTMAIVRLRQNGENNLALSFFSVDDYAGAIDIGGRTVRPGEADYAAAAQGRAYQVLGGGTAIAGPGQGQFEQTALLGVDAGDIIAMKLVNNTTGQTFWSFAPANETVDGQAVAHLWNYGMNTWGFEDMLGGGDRDYNDLVIGLDFTSAAGHGYLV